MKKYYERDVKQLEYFLSVLSRFLVGMGGNSKSPLVNIESQPIEKVSGWTWYKIGFNFTCGVFGACVYLLIISWLFIKLLALFGI